MQSFVVMMFPAQSALIADSLSPDRRAQGIEGMRLGAFDFLMKPIRIEELVPRMLAACEKARPSPETGEDL